MIDFLHVIPAFAITVLVIVAVPGQGVAMVLRQSILSGKQAAFYSVCLLYTSPSPRDYAASRMPSSA